MATTEPVIQPLIQIPQKGYYHKNPVTRFFFTVAYFRFYIIIDTILLFLNLVLICLPDILNQHAGLSKHCLNPRNCIFLHYMSLHRLVHRPAPRSRLGWSSQKGEDYVRDSGCSGMLRTLVITQFEMFIYSQPYSKFFAFRALFLLGYFKGVKMPKELKIFVKSVLHFMVYLPGYMIIMGFSLLILNSFALNVFPDITYLDEQMRENQRDNYLKYLLTTLRIVLASDWGPVMLT